MNELQRAAHQNTGGIAGEFLYFLKTSKKWWLLPFVVIFLLFGLLLLFSSTAAAPPGLSPNFARSRSRSSRRRSRLVSAR